MLIGDEKLNFMSLNATSYPLPACLGSNSGIRSTDLKFEVPAVIPRLDGTPLICGGVRQNDSCFLYQAANDSLTPFSSTIASGRYRGWAFQPGVGIILAGSSNPASNTVEISRYPDYGSKFEELADTRQAYTPFKGLYGACLVMVDDSTLLMIGGRNGANNLYCNTAYLNLTSNSWTSGPQLSVCRRHATCNLITNSSSGQREVVVVGGTNKLRTDCIDLNEVEIINVDTNEVRNATNFPYHVKFHASLNYEDSFLLMGGQYRSNCSLSVGQKNWIYQYNKEGDSWEKFHANMPTKMRFHSAMYVTDICD